MFHRRLALLLLVAMVTVIVLSFQLINLTVAQGNQLRKTAESRLQEKHIIPTVRGRILDRQNRVLAIDEPSYNLAIHYDLLTNNWVERNVRRLARQQAGASWAVLDVDQREVQYVEARMELTKSVEEMWATMAAVTHTERQSLDSNRAKVLEHVQKLATSVWQRWQQQMSEKLDEELSISDVATRVREQNISHVILQDLPDDMRLQIQRLVTQGKQDKSPNPWNYVSIVPAKKRVYPFETQTFTINRSTMPKAFANDEPLEMTERGVGMHLVGYTRNILAGELDDKTGRWDGYAASDRVGAWGVERVEEPRLRGERGYQVLDRETGNSRRHDPILGKDVVLSVDIALQGRIQAIMDQRSVEEGGLGMMRYANWRSREEYLEEGTPLNGSAVVLDVAQGQVLAAVSMPTITLAQLRGEEKVNLSDPINLPYLNRVISLPLMPGSIVKPLVLAAGISDHIVGVDETIYCHGQYDPPHGPRCWIKNYFNGEHGPLDGAESVARSCNVYFSTVGARFGARNLVSWYDRYNLGKVTGCGLEEEVRGYLPDLAMADHPNASGFHPNEAVQMSFGQGPVGWTPLQAANAYAVLARRGYMVSPTFFKYADGTHEQTIRDLHLSSQAIDATFNGLTQSIYEDYGGGHHFGGFDGKESVFNFPNVKIMGKSGTAEAPKLRIDGQIVRAGDHAWFVAMVQRPGSTRPDYVVVVVVEYGGSGAAVSGPIVNQILYAMQAENYL